MRVLGYITVLLMLLLTPAGLSAEQSVAGLSTALQASVKIMEIRGLEVKSRGSGTFVQIHGENLLVTANHILPPDPTGTHERREYLVCALGIRASCEVISHQILRPAVIPLYDVEDWVVVKTKMPEGVKPTRLVKSRFRMGENLWIIGNPSGNSWVSGATVAWLWESGLMNGAVGIDGFIYPGSSGGGAFDKKGRLKGIVTAGLVSVDPIMSLPRIMEDQGVVIPVPEPKMLKSWVVGH